MLHIFPGYGTYLNLDEEIIARASIVYIKSNLKMTQNSLDSMYDSCPCDIFKIDNTSVYHIFSKIFMDINMYVSLKHRNIIEDGQAMYFDVHMRLLGLDHETRQAAEAERKLQNLHHDERKVWH